MRTVITFDPKDLAYLTSMGDFYRKIGLLDRMREENLSVSQIYMGRRRCEELSDHIKRTLRRSKRYAGFTDRYIDAAVGIDWLSYSPTISDLVPKNEVWVFDSTEEARGFMAAKEAGH